MTILPPLSEIRRISSVRLTSMRTSGQTSPSCMAIVRSVPPAIILLSPVAAASAGTSSSKLRGEYIVISFMADGLLFRPPKDLGRLFDGLRDRAVVAAAAEVSRDGGPYLIFRRVGVLI